MKKIFKIMPVVFLLTACTSNEASVTVSTPIPEAPIQMNTATQEDYVDFSQKSAAGELTVLRSCEHDFDMDGKADIINLFTDADISENGDISWDDFHRWVLEVQMSSGGFYTLFDSSVSLGQLYFEVSDIYNSEVVPVITTYLTTSSSLDIRQFAFVQDGFRSTSIYSSEEVSKNGINTVYSSIPIYGNES